MREPLVGREDELARIAAVVSRVAESSGGALVLRGAAGMGKSALLRAGGDLAAELGIRVLSVTGVQAEGRLPFAALRQLLEPLRKEMPDGEPVTADVPAGEPHAAGLSALELLSSAGSRQPLCLVVDDAQWIDRRVGRRWPSWGAAWRTSRCAF